MTDQTEIRAKIVAEARSWLGTPYHHLADVKRAGVDCGMLLVRVFVDLGLVSPFDPRPYTQDWMLHRSEERYLGLLLDRARPVDAPSPGDIALFKVGRCYSHGAIVSKVQPLTLVHAVIGFGKVVEEVASTNPQIVERLPTARFASVVGGHVNGAA